MIQLQGRPTIEGIRREQQQILRRLLTFTRTVRINPRFQGAIVQPDEVEGGDVDEDPDEILRGRHPLIVEFDDKS